MAKEYVKCYYCNEQVRIADVVKYNISKDADKVSNKNFHAACLNTYKEKALEYQKWDRLYEYVRTDVMQYSKEMQLSPHFRNRLLGLHNGTYGMSKGDKVTGNAYSLETIYRTFVVKKADIQKAIRIKAFPTEQQKVNYIMAIISNSINDVYLKEQSVQKNAITLDRNVQNVISEFVVPVNTEVKKKDKKENKVADRLKHLL